jgi:hypothetical protein
MRRFYESWLIARNIFWEAMNLLAGVALAALAIFTADALHWAPPW